MGLIQAFKGSVTGELANQWKEFFVCDSINGDTLIKRADHKVSGRSTNTKGNTDVITKGSVVIVNEGQCAIIVDNGKVLDIAAEAGAYEWDEHGSASVFAGNFAKVFGEMGKRFTFGGEKPVQQRVYFVNTKEIVGLKFGTPAPVPFRIVDNNIGLDLDTSIKCNGIYSLRISDPTQIYSTLAGNVKDEYSVSDITEQIRSILIESLQPALGKISEMGIRPSGMPSHTEEISNVMHEEINEQITMSYGLEVCSVQIISATIPEADTKMLQDLQKQGVYRNQAMAGAILVEAQAEAMKAAASNANGAMMGFYGMNMAAQAGGANAMELLNKGAINNEVTNGPTLAPTTAATVNTPDGWVCSCGTINKGKFCMECGKAKPVTAFLYKCDKCGWEPEDPSKPPKFCPECGDPFTDDDKVK